MIAEIVSVLGPPPLGWYKQLDAELLAEVEAGVKRIPTMDVDRYFRLTYSGDLAWEIMTEEEKAQGLLIDEDRPKPEFSTLELDHLTGLLQQLLRWRPEERMSAEEVLRNPFFAER